MLYWKNLPLWERLVRFVVAMASGFCSFYFWGTPVGWAFGAFAILTVLTALAGFCPMCALAGRRLDARAKESLRGS